MKKNLKKLFIAVTCITMLGTFGVKEGHALSKKSSPVITEVEYIGDGIYCETTIEEITNDSQVSDPTPYATKSGSKTSTFKNSAGQTLWYVKVTADFTYNGSTSTCTYATVSADAPGSDWKISSKSSGRSGNKAHATATADRYLGSTIVQVLTRTVNLECSKNGTLS